MEAPFSNVRRNYIRHAFAGAFLFIGVQLVAQEDHAHMHMGNAGELGKVNFPVSCDAKTQKQFEAAVAMLHSFWYDQSEKNFAEITKTDPQCGIAYWGIAMSLWHPLWQPPDNATLKKGWDIVETARSKGGKTELENELIAALELFYKDYDKAPALARTKAYEDAMKKIYEKYPDNTEVSAFYALSLLGTVQAMLPFVDKTYAKQKQAEQILEKIFTAQPSHPGASHYIIHSFDYPDLATLALPAARNYAKIAPASPHAQHMPSHIFTRLGLWDESIASNIASAQTAKDFVEKNKPGCASYDQLHALDYLEYAYLQCGEDKKAQEVCDELKPMNKVDRDELAAAYAFAAVPTRFAIERSQWKLAADLELHPAGFSWNLYPQAEAIIHFGRAVGYARTGDIKSSDNEIQKIKSLYDTLVSRKMMYWAGQTKILETEGQAWNAFAQKKFDDALTKMKDAVNIEDSSEKHPVTPGAILPAHEQLGDLLLLLNKPADAFPEYETSLKSAPNRFNSLYGAARSAQLKGDKTSAAKYYIQLMSLTSHADTERPELKEARTFVAAKN
ncbi:MAG TPA: hypothetical protein VEV83_17405 [Parafilimonas sp.]|nr:hypothetical protein [Parafilimonas sp.]